jgi:hypothetical protein
MCADELYYILSSLTEETVSNESSGREIRVIQVGTDVSVEYWDGNILETRFGYRKITSRMIVGCDNLRDVIGKLDSKGIITRIQHTETHTVYNTKNGLLYHEKS